MLAPTRDLINILQRVDVDPVSSGFLEEWVDLGRYYASVIDVHSVALSLQEKFTRSARYHVRISGGPLISFRNTRFKWINRYGKELVLQPDADPRTPGSTYRQDTWIACIDIAPFEKGEDPPVMAPSVNFPPTLVELYYRYTFTATGTQTVFTLPPLAPPILPGAKVEIKINDSLQERNFDYLVNSASIEFKYPPIQGTMILIKYRQ